MDDKVNAGDHVTVGEFGEVHWIVLRVSPGHRSALLQSPMSGRSVWRPLGDLKIHTKGSSDA